MNNDALEAQQLYDDQSAEYSLHQSKNIAVEDLRRRVYALAGPLKDRCILFAGCGDGVECLEAVSKGAIVAGIDISQNNIKTAQQLDAPNAEFQVMDIQKLDFDASSFEIIISILAVMYVADLDIVMSEFNRVLAAGGRAVIVVSHPLIKMMKYNSKNNYFLRGKQWETWQGIKRFNYYRLFEDYVASFVGAGLRMVKILEPEPMLSEEELKQQPVAYPHFAVFELSKPL